MCVCERESHRERSRKRNTEREYGPEAAFDDVAGIIRGLDDRIEYLRFLSVGFRV